jgi:3-deoxy-D-manno-octulosonate 8-phosphate phosphatase (KDO 8-P phosphatase)
MQDRLARIKLLAMDVDGTLTDGGMIFLDGAQIKVYNVHDGLGITLAMRHGLGIAWVTGNFTPSVTERAIALGVTEVHQGARHKRGAIQEILRRHGLSREEVAFIGDDLNDIPAMEEAGFAFAVADAADEVKAQADMVTARDGGRGAVREAIEAIFRSRGEWERVVSSFVAELESEEADGMDARAVN